MKREFSAGGIVYRYQIADDRSQTKTLLFLVRRSSGGTEYRGSLGWSLPKGWIDAEEKPEETAVREVKEEVGVEAKIIQKLETIKIFFTDVSDGQKVMKFITYYLMEWISDLPGGYGWETAETAWMDIEEIKKNLVYPSEKKAGGKGLGVIAMKWVIWIGLFVTMAGIGIMGLDPDYGWHVAMGEYIWEKGIPVTDPFSYTMPSYPFVDHEWLLNILFYWGEQTIGKNGLAIILGGVAVLALMTVPRKPGWELGVILAAGILIHRVGVRPQVLDWLLVAVLWRFWQGKYKWWLPAMFLLWTNLHGGFAIGILMWLFMLVAKSITERRWQMADVKNWVLALMVTFINPYGWRIWWEVWMQVSDRNLGKVIMEWLPFYTQVEPSLWILLALWICFVINIKKRVDWKIIVMGATLLAGLKSLRHVPFFAILVAMELPNLIENFWQSLVDEAKIKAVIVYKVFVGISLLVLGIEMMLINLKIEQMRRFYPEKAVKYLQQTGVKGRLFSEYGWGGYLIWKYPSQKVFIDGRMPSWRDNKAGYAMEEYMEVYNGANFDGIFSKYGIESVLLAKPKRTNFVEKWLKIKPRKGKYLVEELEKAGWKIVYEDDIAVVYIREI